MVQVHYKSAFEGMTLKQIIEWIELYQDRLIGSAIFTQNNGIGSKIVRWAEKWSCKENHFIPSHTGSIIRYKDDIYIFDMKPPKASVQKLANYLYSTKEDFVLILRDFPIDTRMFSLNLIDHIGESYPYMSAIRSVFTKRQSKFRTHCSELHYRQLLRQGINFGINPECTPDELYHLLIKGYKNDRSDSD